MEREEELTTRYERRREGEKEGSEIKSIKVALIY